MGLAMWSVWYYVCCQGEPYRTAEVGSVFVTTIHVPGELSEKDSDVLEGR